MKVCPHIEILYSLCKDPYDGIESMTIKCEQCMDISKIELKKNITSRLKE